MKFLIQIASRQRPQKLFRLIEQLFKKSSTNNQLHVLVSADNDDPDMNNKNIKQHCNVIGYRPNMDLQIMFSDRTDKIDAANRDIGKISTAWDVLVALDDDMMPIEKGWDNYIEQGFKQHFANGDGALWFFDGHQKHLLTYAVMGKKYYDRFGYIYHPDYKSFYCDNEFMEVALRLNRLQKPFWPKCIIEHQHYAFSNDTSKNKLAGADSLYVENFKFLQQDYQTYMHRKSINFGL